MKCGGLDKYTRKACRFRMGHVGSCFSEEGFCRVCHERLLPGEVVCLRHEALVVDGDARGGDHR